MTSFKMMPLFFYNHTTLVWSIRIPKAKDITVQGDKRIPINLAGDLTSVS